jgi:hypothetical protein
MEEAVERVSDRSAVAHVWGMPRRTVTQFVRALNDRPPAGAFLAGHPSHIGKISENS